MENVCAVCKHPSKVRECSCKCHQDPRVIKAVDKFIKKVDEQNKIQNSPFRKKKK